jgi:general secretion pathway protein L
MAHKILGLDLGSYSVKLAQLDAGFRQSRLIGLYERRLLEPVEGESELQRGARTLAALMSEAGLEAEMFASGVGAEATLRLLEMPFSDPKKIEQVLGYELESQILGELSDLVYDCVIGETRPRDDGSATTQVVAVAAARTAVREHIDALAAVGAEPRMVGAVALSYAALRGHAFASDGVAQAIIDFGHRYTQVCVVRGERVLFARSIARGGEDVTVAIADGFRMTAEDAERAKHEQAFIGEPGAALASPAHQRVDALVREAVRPLVRELKQTMAAFRAGGEGGPERVLVTGGAARLAGLIEHLELELGVPVQRLALLAEDPLLSPEIAAQAQAGAEASSLALPAQAFGLALAEATPVPQVNLRKGELAYRTDYSYLRGKAGYVAAAVLAVLACAGLNAAASLRVLRKEGEVLEAKLRMQTRELFGEERTDGKAISEELRQGPKGGAPPIPTLSAFDVLDEISHNVPSSENAKLDILELDIKPKKTYLKATAETAAQIDEVAATLGKIECFDKIEKGTITTVTALPSGEAPAGAEKHELKQFTLNITTSCP